MKNLSFKLPDEIAVKLVTESKKRHVSKSMVVREALAQYLTDKQHQGKPQSFLDLAYDLCGCAVGPSDLASNPKHLDHFGE